MPKKPSISSFEKKHLQNTVDNIKRIRKAYEGAIIEIVAGVDYLKFNGQVFKVSDYPVIKKQIDAQIKKLKPKVESLILNGIKTSWDLSNEKNNLIVDKRIGKRRPNPKAKKIYYDPNEKALESFMKRTVNGMNLSDRVWRAMEPFKSELEAGLSVGIREGKSAANMAKDMKQFLNEPDKLFRRVRNAEGKLVLSKAARDYHPGQGVYRSSYKNAVRLTRTENNIAYRTADHERWKTLPFVTGIEVRLSAAHPTADICDHLVGEYPKEFKFVGFHPQCICYAVPKMMSDEEYDKLEDAILNGDDFPESKQSVTDIPDSSKKWLSDNSGLIARLSNTPYFIKDNKDIIGSYIKK